MSDDREQWGHGLIEFGHGDNLIVESDLVAAIEEEGGEVTAWAGPECEQCDAPVQDEHAGGLQILCDDCLMSAMDHVGDPSDPMCLRCGGSVDLNEDAGRCEDCGSAAHT